MEPHIRFEAFGARIGIQTGDASIRERLEVRLPPGSAPTTSVDLDHLYTLAAGAPENEAAECYLLDLDGERLAKVAGLDAAEAALESDMHFRVAVSARGWLFVHAGVVGWRDRAIVIPGRTQSGKSSLTLAFVGLGATYYSDEFAVLGPEGRVHPYRKPLSQRRADGTTRLIPAEELGDRPDSESLPVGLVLVTRHEPGARWRPAELSRADCVLAQFDNTVVARLAPERALDVLTRSVTGATCLRGPRGDAEQTARAVLDYLDRAPAS